MADYVASGYADSAEDFKEYSKIICQLPSVTPQEPTVKAIPLDRVAQIRAEIEQIYEQEKEIDKKMGGRIEI